MKLIERQIPIPAAPGHRNMIAQIQKAVEFRLEEGAVPVRFAITRMDETHYQCEFASSPFKRWGRGSVLEGGSRGRRFFH